MNLYKVGDFRKADKIAVLCRGKSLSLVRKQSDFDHCYVVGQFDNASKVLSSCLKDKKLVQVINKSSRKVNEKTAQRLGIKDIQCNFDGWKNRPMSVARKRLYKDIRKINKWARVHLAPSGIRERRPMGLGWETTGIFAVDLAAFWEPKEIVIYGLDFYSVPSWKKEKINASWKKNRKRQKDMLHNFHAIVKRDSKVSFTIHTFCESVGNFDNLNVIQI